MNVEKALEGVNRLFLDTAPVIYYFEKHEKFFPLIHPIFQRLSDGDLKAVSSPITLAECCILPIREELLELKEKFEDALVWNSSVEFFPIDDIIAIKAAEIRAKYNNIKLPDAIQLATAIVSNCDAFLTNDDNLSKVREIRSIVVKKLKI
jgi:predicted nucleic acid-binding protein